MALPSLSILLIAFLQSGVPAGNNDSTQGKRPSFIHFTIGVPNIDRGILHSDFKSQLNQLESWTVNNLSAIGYTVAGIGPVSVKAEHRIAPWLGAGPVIYFSRASIIYQIAPTPANSPGLNKFLVRLL